MAKKREVKSRRTASRRTSRTTSRRAEIKRLYRSGKNKILGGVCGGLADYFNVDPTIVRILWIIFGLAYGSGLLAYLIAWIIIPRNPRDRW
ncbi:MAG: PspC domain-containing protein [Candidatus Aenigmatarchaeota archaeon]